MRKLLRAKYRTTNWTEYNAALKRRGSLMVWLEADLQWPAQQPGKVGRPAQFCDAAIQFCMTLKCMFGLAESLLQLARLDRSVLDDSILVDARRP